MTDFLKIEKLGMEDDRMVLNITGSCPCITASSRIYVTGAMLSELSDEILTFLKEKNLEGYWENDVPGIGGPPCVTLKILPWREDEQVLLEIYMELNDGGGFATHNCCFYIRSCRSCLKEFSHQLSSLKEAQPGTMLILQNQT